MVENLGLFFKIIVYLLAVCRSISAQYDEFNCKRGVNNNSTTVCKLYSNKNSFLPTEDISNDTESLIISTFGDGSLAITRTDIFQNFEQLKNLEIQIGGSFHISENLLDSASINYLQNLLFNIPNLKTLSIKYNRFNDKSYSWMLPANLEKLYLSNGVFEFNLRSSSHLALVQLNHNNLSKIPWSYDSSPALKILHLRNNPLNEFSVDDIADLCHLQYYAMDTYEISNCECNKLKQWIMKLQEWGDFTFGGSLNCSDDIGSYLNCTLDEAMLRREKKCSTSTWWNRNKNWILLASEAGGAAGVLLFCCGACCFGCCVMCCFCLVWLVAGQPQKSPPVRSWDGGPRGPGNAVYPEYLAYPEYTNQPPAY